MKFQIDANEFRTALASAKKIAKVTQENYVTITALYDGIMLTVKDEEITGTIFANADVKENDHGACTYSLTELWRFAKVAQDFVEVNDDVLVDGWALELRALILPEIASPANAFYRDFQFATTKEQLRDLNKKVAKFANPQAMRRALNFVVVDGPVMYGCDAYRLMAIEHNHEVCIRENEVLYINSQAMKLAEALARKGTDFSFYEGAIEGEGWAIVYTEFTGDYPKLQPIIDTSYTQEVIVESERMLHFCKAAKNAYNRMTLTLTPDGMVRMVSGNLFVEFPSLGYAGEELSIAFNFDYMREILETLKVDRVKLSLINDRRQVKFEDEDGGLPYAILMPMYKG